MKPVAPLLPLDAAQDDEPSLQSEIVRMCDEREARGDNERITLPAPPTPETLRMATPFPPPREETSLDTIPAPPPSAARKRADSSAEIDSVPSTIPGPPRLPRIAEA
jgi:hypothetical protein